MKRVKIMLSAICVMAIVAGALAFKAKTEAVCVYARTITVNPPSTTTCPLVGTGVFSITTAGATTQYASFLPTVANSCPTATTVCSQSKTLTIE